jgi:hypothetical protein
MSLKKHTFIVFSLIAIVFLFVNSNCLASPVIKNALQHEIAFNCTLSQSLHLTEPQERGYYQSPSYDTEENHFSLRTQTSFRFLKRNSDQQSFEFPQTCYQKAYEASYNPLLRPAYYSFLFRLNLF